MNSGSESKGPKTGGRLFFGYLIGIFLVSLGHLIGMYIYIYIYRWHLIGTCWYLVVSLGYLVSSWHLGLLDSFCCPSWFQVYTFLLGFPWFFFWLLGTYHPPPRKLRDLQTACWPSFGKSCGVLGSIMLRLRDAGMDKHMCFPYWKALSVSCWLAFLEILRARSSSRAVRIKVPFFLFCLF